jgi:3',5'-cyclic-AMP phosphodiesterase
MSGLFRPPFRRDLNEREMSSRRSFVKKIAATGALGALGSGAVNAQSSTLSRKRVLRVAHITDVHLLKKKNAEENFSLVLRKINGLADKPDFILNTGDTVMDENKQTRETVESSWAAWRAILKKENNLPVYSALGNHDVWYGPTKELDDEYRKDLRYGKQWAITELGMPGRFYSFESKGWQFIALDSINGEKGYEIDDEQFAWLEELLTNIGREKPVCVFSHVPILSIAAQLSSSKSKSKEEQGFPFWEAHRDQVRLKDLFYKTGNVRLCLSGHVHYVDCVDYLGTKYLCNGAVSGNWWRSPMRLDEFPPVFTIIDLFDDGAISYQHIYYGFIS